MTRPSTLHLMLTLALGLAACSDDGPAPEITISKAVPSGDVQTGPTSTALPDPLRVVVRRDGEPLSGAGVTWNTEDPGAEVNPATGVTDGDGIAATTWTLGQTVGPQTATAELDGATGSPVTFAAVATLGSGGGAEVTVGDNFFTPAQVTIDAGETVTWTWGNYATSHSVRSTGSPGFTSSGILSGAGSAYSVQFDTPGTYTYDCEVHGSAMTGTVTVE